jgi:hypothetical protein
MLAKDAIRECAELSRMVLKRYIEDLSDAELCRRPGPGCNHVAWQLGHLISSECSLLNLVRPGSAPELPAGFAEQHDKDHTASDDPSQFCTKNEYLKLLDQVHAASMKVLETFSPEDFDQPAPERLRNMFPTMGATMLLIASHPMMHAGQFVPVRRALGKPVVI